MSNSGDGDDVSALRDDVDEKIKDMPAETALGNRDPAGGGEGDPKEYDSEHNDQF